MYIREDIKDTSTRGKMILLYSREELVSKLREMKKGRKKFPRLDKQWYFSNKSFGYVRYADDFVVLLGNYHK